MPDLLLVRHASAGPRGSGPGDLDRPLDERGTGQAAELARRLAPLLGADADLRTSPARRCVETLAPLAATLGRTPVVDAALVEGSDIDVLVARIEVGLAGPTVWVSHGDVIPELLARLARRGLDLGTDPRCAKGSVWVLSLGDGGATTARYLPPPA